MRISPDKPTEHSTALPTRVPSGPLLILTGTINLCTGFYRVVHSDLACNPISKVEGETEVVKGPDVSVLVVDDFAHWRSVVRDALQAKLGLCLFEEGADGLEAVQKAAVLQPNLVILDMGLPKLNGIEAARRIGLISPKSKVIFLTENNSCDLAEAALNSGAKGYVIKSAFAGEFIIAVEAVLEGREFLSARLSVKSSAGKDLISAVQRCDCPQAQ